jgi:hypothetical protein
MGLRYIKYALLAGLVAFTGATRSHAQSKAPQQSLNDGYSQFYSFCGQEKNLSLLNFVKTTTPEIADYEKRISETATRDMAILTKFAANTQALRLDTVSLSSFETSVRHSMDADREHRLIFGASGASYSEAVLMTQCEATNYGLHVAKILSQIDPNSDRAAAMNRIFEHWSRLHEEAYRLNK